MFSWISLRAPAAAPGPSSHFMMIPASRARNEPWLLLKESSAFMPTFKAVTVSVPSVEASAGVEAPGEVIAGTRRRLGDLPPDLRLRLLPQLPLGVEPPTLQLP